MSAVAEGGCTALERGGDSFADVVGERAQHLRADFCGHVLAQFPDSKGGVEQVLGLGDSERGADGDLFTDTDCGAV